MRHIVDSGKICVIQLHAPSLLALYKTDLMPYVIFISAPNIETLREIFVSRMQKDLSDQELKETVEASMEIEKEYACYFDKVIRLTDLDRTYDELFSTMARVSKIVNVKNRKVRCADKICIIFKISFLTLRD